MDKSAGNRKDPGKENHSAVSWSVPEIIVELVRDLRAFEDRSGLPCSNCTCALTFHVVRKSIACVNCGCFHFKPFRVITRDGEEYQSYRGRVSRECVKCGFVKLRREFLDDSSSCNRCNGIRPATVDSIESNDYETLEDWWDWSAAAREALMELTE